MPALSNAEPYLWTVFFKVDGDTALVNTDDPSHVFLQGVPTVVTTPGNHGNRGTSDVDEGDDVGIPAIIGEYRTIMKPIPLTTPVLDSAFRNGHKNTPALQGTVHLAQCGGRAKSVRHAEGERTCT